ncbi:MAG TPA: M48 family metallopeptidase [Thermoanaerobaculia bacterium]|nr:M48 family metallopeptidase [Thermoanaerobaculia bacterium]
MRRQLLVWYRRHAEERIPERVEIWTQQTGLAHELAHLLHPGHTRDFWAALGRILPDYEERREALRRLGDRLVW